MKMNRLLQGRYPLALSMSLISACLLLWLSLGVGIIGKDGDPANRMYFAVLIIGVIGSLAARFRPRGMAVTLGAMALAQAVIAAIALIQKLGHPWSGALELILLNGFFIVLFFVSAALFTLAIRKP